MNNSLQIIIRLLMEDIVRAITFKNTQRPKPQKQHVQLASNVAVFMTRNVMEIYGIQVKGPPSPLTHKDLAHGLKVNADHFL